ncbi:MAG: hypothetical protein ABFS86_17655 [Planctomycetota bacterium]
MAMEELTTSAGSQPIIPIGEVPCVWMAAGVLTFRLCDRDLECGDCPLDRAIRNEPQPETTTRSSEGPAAGFHVPDKAQCD